MENNDSNKRQRRTFRGDDCESAAQGAPFRRDEAEFDVGAGWRVLVLRLGEKCPEYQGRADPTQQIEFAATVLRTNFDGLHADLLPLLMQCAEELPHKAPFYASLLGILNVHSEQFGRSAVGHVYSGMQAALDTAECNKLRLLLRILTLLMCNGVVSPSALLSTFSLLLNASLSPAQHAPQNQSRPSSWQPRADFFVFSVLAALPFGVSELLPEHAEEVERVLQLAQEYMSLRCPLPLTALSVFAIPPDAPPPQDYLQDLWARIAALKEASWAASAVPRPYEQLREQLQGGVQHEGEALHIAPFQEDTPMDPISSSSTASLAADKELFQQLSSYPPRKALLKLFAPTKTDSLMAPIDRFLVQEYILDILQYLNGCRKECAGCLVGLPVPFRYEYVLAETIFSQMLLLPSPPFCRVYYTVVLVDLCKALPAAFPAVLASAVRLLFSRMPGMDPECRVRVVQWLAHHLSNFAYVWPWEAWAAVARQPEWSPQRMFAAEVIEKEVRLSYYEKVKESLGSAAMEELLPSRPQPAYTYGEASTKKAREAARAEEQGGGEEGGAEAAKTGGGMEGVDGSADEGSPLAREIQLSRQLAEMVKNRAKAREVGEWVLKELSASLGPAKAVDVAVQTLLVLGSKSLSHSSTLLERYVTALQTLAPDQEGQVRVVESVVRLWKHSSQMAAVLVDRCMGLRIITNLAIVEWVFSPSNFPLFHSSDRVWEILRNAVSKTANKAADLHREVAALQRNAAAAAALAVRAKLELEEARTAGAAVEDEAGKTAASVRSVWAEKEALKAEEEALSAKEAAEAKAALLHRAAAEQKSLFTSIFRHFSTAVDQRVGQAEVERDRMEEDEEGKEGGERGEGRKRSKLEEVEEKEWLRCTLGTLCSICRYYAKQVWDIMESIEEVVQELRPDVVKAINAGLSRP